MISNFDCGVDQDDCLLVAGDNYHPTLNITVREISKWPTLKSNISEKVYDFKRANFPGFYQDNI